ncbi:MAG TPA: hypothetical protein H9898_09095 [Candidatus Anaerobiospirillum stercoravium]|nr:hypothetical protein [Candidatus Anaerobiospirillum stercoravium]
MGWYKSLPIKTKLLISFMSIIILTCIITTSALLSMRNAQQVASYVTWTLEERYVRIDRVIISSRNLQNELILYVDAENRNVRGQVESSLHQRINELKQYADELQTGRFPQEITAIKQDINLIINLVQSELIPIARTIDDASPANQGDIRQRATHVYTTKILAPLDNAFTNLNTVRDEQVKEVVMQVNSIASSTPMVVVSCIALFSIVLALAIALISAEYIKRALHIAIEHIQYFEACDFSHEVKTGYSDEFGHVGKALEHLRTTMIEVINKIHDMSSRISSDMSDAEEAVNRLSRNASDSENRTITIAAAANEMVSTTQNIAQNCESASNLANQSSDITTQGMAQAKTSIQAIYDQAEQTKTNNKQMETMINQSRSITSMVNTIDEIAAQTNLLALNAAIEAARAGEAGRGFAVVADEVRALAMRTSASTSEIAEKVSHIEADTNAVTESMNKAVQGMSQLADNTSELEHVLTDIAQHVQNVTMQITQIATAAEEQTAATHEISSNMQDLTASTREVAQIATDCQMIVTNTNAEVGKLEETMRQFKL